MPKVEINSQGVSIHVEATEASATELGELALRLFKDANDVDAKKSPGPAMGFRTERESS